jgi:DNA replicative helicase MCM subunit Mcm2 (Cdc46/Mcm family)
MTPGQTPKMITIICQNTQPGQIRPADPILVLGTAIANPSGSIVQCGDFSTQISASVVNE